MSDVLLALGILVVLATASSVVLTLILPRAPRRSGRFTRVVVRSVQVVFILISRLGKSYETKDAILAPTAPVALVAQLLYWAGGFILGYALMLLPFVHNVGDALSQAATSLFTLGAIPVGGSADQPVDIAAGATWAVIVALQIAYLPALYSAFNKREGLVTMLESRAGLPSWGPELLARHQLVGITDTLAELYDDWEEWGADVSESHTTYPVMLLFRSPEPWASWVTGLIAVLDACALHLALCPGTAPHQARLCLRMGFSAFNRIGATLGWHPDPDPAPDGAIDLSFDDFAEAVSLLAEVGFPLERSAEEAWPDFRGWRINYETTAYRMADYVTAPPAPWSGNRRHLRSGTVAPRRPPQRAPGLGAIASHRPTVTVESNVRRRRGEPEGPGG